MRFLPFPLALLLVALAGILVLLPGSGGPFLLDDFANIAHASAFQVENWDWEAIKRAVLTNNSGPLGRPVSTLSFVLNAATFGIDPLSLKLTNIFLHAITAVLAALVVLRLFRLTSSSLASARLMAVLVGLAWSVHPIALTSTLYVVQRMNLLAALFTLAALLAYMQGRRWLFSERIRAGLWFAFAALLWLLGVLSKENALLLPLFIVLLEWLIYRFQDDTGNANVNWRRFVLLTTAAGFAVLVFFIVSNWGRWAAGYETRGFSLVERLLTESRVLWQYIGMVLAPSHERLGLFLDDIQLSKGLFAPLSTFFALCGLAGLVAIAISARKKLPLLSFGLLFFLAGHLMESTIFPLEIAFEHRNYLPAIGLLLALAATLQVAAARLEVPLVAWFPLLAFCAFLAIFATIRSIHWGDQYLLVQLEAQHHPQSARALTELGAVYVAFAHRAHVQEDGDWTEFYFTEAAAQFENAIQADPHIRSPLFAWMLNAHLLERQFPDAAYAQLLQRLRHGAPTSDTPGALDQIFQCLEHICRALAPRLDELLQAALQNPRLKGRTRSETMVVAGKFFRDVRKEPEWALYWFGQAAATSPGQLRFRLFLARQLVAMERYADAREEVAEIVARDAFGVYSQDVNQLLADVPDEK